MTPFAFGRSLKTAFELPPKPAENPTQPVPTRGAFAGQPQPNLTQTAPKPITTGGTAPLPAPKPVAPPVRKNIHAAPTNAFQSWLQTPGGFMGGAGAGGTGSRWYNPWTKQEQVQGAGEQTMKRIGQGALAVGGLAAGGALALPAVAPGLAAAPLSAVPGMAATAATNAGTQAAAGLGAAGTWASNQAQRGGQAVNNAINSAQDFGNSIAANLYTRTPESVNHALQHYGEIMEPVEKSFPSVDKYTTPFETLAHEGPHMVEHLMETGDGLGHAMAGVR